MRRILQFRDAAMNARTVFQDIKNEVNDKMHAEDGARCKLASINLNSKL